MIMVKKIPDAGLPDEEHLKLSDEKFNTPLPVAP